MRRLTALALVLVCLTPCAGLAQETVEADFEGGHWLYEDTAQGVRVLRRMAFAGAAVSRRRARAASRSGTILL